MPFASGNMNFNIGATSASLTNQVDGTYLAIWSDGSRIWGQGFDVNGAHIGPGQFLIQGGATYSDVNATLLSNGDMIITWIEGGSIRALRLGADHQAIGTVQDLGSTQVNNQHSPKVYDFGSGNYTVLYKGNRPFDNLSIVAQTTVQGQSVSKDPLMSADDYHHAFTILANNASITLYNNGGSIQVEDWTNQKGGDVPRTDPTAPIHQSATALADGKLIVGWEDADPISGTAVVRAQVLNSDYSKNGAAVTFAAPSGTIQAIDFAQLSDKSFVLLLTMNNGTDKDVYVATCSQTGTILMQPSLIGQNAAGDQIDPQIVTLADGKFAVSWLNTTDSTLMTEVFGGPTDLNTAPTNIHLTSGGTTAHVVENSPSGHVVATVVSDDNGSLADLRYFMTDNTFAIDATTGQIRVKDGVVLNYEGTNSYTVAVIVKDQNGAGLSSTRDITIKVGDVLEAVQGTKGKNVLTGGIGADRLNGGGGNDVLTGKAGSDIFVFDTALGKGTTPANQNKKVNFDTITDFNATDDSIWLDNKIFTKLGKSGSENSPAHLNKSFFKLGKATDKNDYIIYKTGIIYYDADGVGTKYKPVEIIKLTNSPKITADDFFVV